MTAEFDRLRSALADRYRVEREVGSGGMATVYLAHDVRHDRQVAIKVLRPDLASVIGADRFLAEIKTTANLQHPHILGLIESGEVAGTVFYVMPFVRGESLRTRLEREQQLPIADAVRIATQVASALDYAHRSGIIHRDIKPENILLHDEQALVADFGIALAVTRSGDGRRRTEAGTSLGTPQYMSPEQAMGDRSLDARTDVYSLGCVLYEMLAGEPPLAGPNAQATIAKVMTVEPEPVMTLRRSVPRHIADATMTALQKVPADRFATAAEFSAALANPQFVAPSGAHRSAGPAGISRRDVAGVAAIAVLVVVALAGWFRRGARDTASVVRYELAADESMNSNQMVIARDGSRLLWGASNAYWERRFDTLGTRRIRDAAIAPATIRDVTPEGRDVLLSGRGGLSLAPLAGGPARVLAAQGPGRGGGGRGGAAIGYDRYVYYTADTRTIARVPLDSGKVDSVATAPDSTFINDIVALPGGHGLIVSLQRNLSSSIYTLDLRSKTWKTLAVGGPHVRYVDAGYLLFANGQYVMAAPFDAGKLTFTQQPVPYLEATSDISMIAANGNVLAYRAGTDAQGDVGMELRTLRGDKQVLANVPDATRFSGFAVSPDGRRFVAVGTAISAPGAPSTSPPNLWVYELPSGPMPRLATTERDNYPAWMPGGRDISFVRFSADTPYTSTMMRRSFDGITTPVSIVKRGLETGLLGQTSWFPSSARAFVQVGGVSATGFGGRGGRGGGRGGRGGPGGPAGRGDAPQRGGPPGGRGGVGPNAGDIVDLNLATPEQLTRVIPSDSAESSPAVNPNGRLFAYTSNNSGQTEVYVSPIDGSTRRQVSLNGGSTPRWAHDGRTLYYAVIATGPGTDTLYAAHVSGTGVDLSVEDRRPVLFGLNLGGGFGILRGDSSFVMRATPADDRRNLPPIVVVRNFAQELKRLFSAASSGSQ